MKYLSFHDSLTGLYNRAYIDHIISEGENADKIVIFMFDIDRLKYVNDNYGHAEGDKLICSFARIIKDSFREPDIVARIGGDEFTTIMYNTYLEMAETIKGRIIDKINVYNESIESHLKLSVSIGYAALDDNETIEKTMKKADEIMYADKMSQTKHTTA